MKITAVQAIPLAAPEPNDGGAQRHVCLVRISTDEGLVGWGEAITMFAEASRATVAIIEGVTPLLVGQDPTQCDRIWQRLVDHTWWYGSGGIAAFAISAIDLACWDLAGKASDSSILSLLGGPARAELPAFISCHAAKSDLAEMTAQMAQWVSPGYAGIKVGFGKFGAAALGLGLDRDSEFMQMLRSAIGPTAKIAIDIGAKLTWSVAEAIDRTNRLAEFDLHWIEEPLGADNPSGYRELKEHTDTLIAFGEREWNARGLRGILGDGTVDVVGIDPGRFEGLTGMWAGVRAVAAAGRQSNAHSWSTGIVGAASLAVSWAAPSCGQLEVKPLRCPMFDELTPDSLRPISGHWPQPTGVGLGVTIDEDFVDAHRVDR